MSEDYGATAGEAEKHAMCGMDNDTHYIQSVECITIDMHKCVYIYIYIYVSSSMEQTYILL